MTQFASNWSYCSAGFFFIAVFIYGSAAVIIARAWSDLNLPIRFSMPFSSGCLAKFSRLVLPLRPPRSVCATILRNLASASCMDAPSHALSILLRMAGTSLSLASTLPIAFDTKPNMSKLKPSLAATLPRGRIRLNTRCNSRTSDSAMPSRRAMLVACWVPARL